MMESTDGNIGRILKERREELGRSLQNAEEATRIRKTYLECLENNQFSELPGQAYVTGFLRVYANYLGLKSNPLLALLNDLQSGETGPAEAGPNTVGSKIDQSVQHAANSGWRKFFLVFVLVLVLGFLFYFLTTFLASNEQVTGSATKVLEDGQTPDLSEPRHAENGKSPAASEESQAPAAGQAQSEESGGPLPSAISARPASGAEHSGQSHRMLPAIPSNGASLRMLALADSSLIIEVDQRKPQQYKLYDGLDLTWKIRQRVHVESAASDVARFWLNGREIDLSGDKSFTLQPAAE